MNVGVDIGYSAVKMVAGARRATFPSVVGSPDLGRFNLNGHYDLILVEPANVVIGETAIVQSRFATRREDRGWIQDDEYYHLFLTALSEATNATVTELVLVTGLPIAFYEDKECVQDRLAGAHWMQRDKRSRQQFVVRDIRVIPQPFGALLAEALDAQGRIVDQELATGTVGVIDVGGKTTNLLGVKRMAEMGPETASVSSGAWDVVRRVRRHLDVECPDLELRDHQVVEAITARQVKYYGEPVDLSAIVDEAVTDLAERVIAEAGQLWGGAGHLSTILIAGGGAHLLGTLLQRHFRHARIVAEPVFANAVGFERFANRIAGA